MDAGTASILPRAIGAAIATLALVVSACGGGGPDLADFEPAAQEQPDRAGISYLDNLEARVAAGEWTLGQGLVETLEFAFGDAEAADVLSTDELITYELTGIVDMARDYVETGSEPEAVAELARLLDLIVFSEEQLQAMARTASQNASEASTRNVALAQRAVEDCNKFFTGWDTVAVPICLEVEVDSELDQLYPGQYKIYKPAPGLPTAGWTKEEMDRAFEALVDSVKKLKPLGTLPPISLVVSPSLQGAVGARAASRYSIHGDFPGRPCGIVLYAGMRILPDPNDFKQVVAHEVGHCFLGDTVIEQSRLPHGPSRWWSEAVPEYLSNWVYPDNNLEVDQYMQQFISNELNIALFDLSYDGFLWWQHVANQIGNQGVIAVIGNLPSTVERDAVEAAMASYPGMDALFHDFGRRITDWDRPGESVLDTDKKSYVPKPGVDLEHISGEAFPQLEEDLIPFRTVRYGLVVDSNNAASLISRPEGLVLESARSPKGQWGPIPEGLPNEECQPVIVTVHTTTFDQGSIAVDVPQYFEVQPGGLPGKWVVNNPSVSKRIKDTLWPLTPNPKSKQAAASGTIRATFTSDDVHVEYDNFSATASISADEAQAGAFKNYVGDQVIDTNASGSTSYSFLGEDLWFAAFLSEQFLRGKEDVSLIETGGIGFGPDNTIPHELSEKFERNPPLGWNIFSGIQEYDVKCDGRVMTLEDDLGRTTLYRVSDGQESWNKEKE